MKTALFYLFICLTANIFPPSSDWYTYQTPEVSIEFPREPDLSSHLVPYRNGNMEVKLATYEDFEDEDSSLAYIFSTFNYPESEINSSLKEKLPEFFRNGIKGLVTKVEGKLISEKEIRLEGFPGREIKVSTENGKAVHLIHLYLVWNRFYIIQTITETGKEGMENAWRFHRSFKLKK